MKRLVNLLSASVRRRPWGVLAGALVVTIFFGSFISQQEMASGNEGFSPDSPEFRALDTISEFFSDNSEEPVQVVVSARDADLLTADGLRDYVLIQQAIETSDVSILLKDRPGGDIVGYFDPVVQSLQERAEEEGVAFETLLADVTDAEVKDAFRTALTETQPELADLFAGLLAAGSDLAEPTADRGLMVAFLNVADLDDPDQTILQDLEVDMAAAVEAAPTVATDGDAFSFALLFANQDEFESEIGRLFATAFLIIVVILLFVYWVTPRERMTRWMSGRRSLADMAVTMLVIVMSITWMNGIGVLLGPKYAGLIGDFSEILQIIPILLIGLGVDYAIHMTSRYREELGDGKSVAEAASRATQTVGIALVLATVTTSVGFLTNVVNPITAIADFGILAAVGITSAFFLMLTVVPSIRVLLDRRAEPTDRLPREAFGYQGERLLPKLMGASSILAQRVPVATLVVAILLAIGGGYGYTQLNTEFSFTDFLPEGDPALETFNVITEEFSGGFGEETEVIIEGDVGTPEVHNALVAAWGNLRSTPDVVQFGERAAAESPVSVIAQLTTPPEDGGDPEVYDATFASAAVVAGLQADLTVASGTDVAALYRLAEEAAGDPMRRVVAEVDGSFRYVDFGVSTQAGEAGALTLKDDLQAAFQPVRDAGATTVATNQNIVSQGVAESLRDSQLSSLFLTVAVAGLILVINFWFEARRPGLGLVTIAPVAFIVLLVFGVMAVRGIPFNPVTAIIANLAIGIGVPYTIHITHRYQEDRLRYATPEEAIRSTTTHTGGALAGSAFTTAAGFGVLITSTLKPFQQFGEVTFWSIVTAMIGAVFVLPSLLVLWDRWHRNRGNLPVEADAIHDALQDAESGLS
ncbi:MAG: MMPL family transporter [Acidimicrobiia bacterium]|nr:MMPL family transporter [Acidimicrobiia bacterium]